ncbi:MAG: hypothetical protein Q8N05_16660 [Bacteroidota bacterium]|nr:hypothetical protein [Bacteroidota bacterium]
MKILIIIGWVVLIVMILAAFVWVKLYDGGDDEDCEELEPDESSHKGRYKYTHPEKDENQSA